MPDVENWTENQQLPPIVKESIKLIQGQKGNVGFEIKILSDKINDEDLERLKNIRKKLNEEYNNRLEEKFGEKK